MSATKYKLVIFDLDGTVLNTLDDLTYSVAYALSKAGYPTRTKEEVRSFVGNGIHKLIERAVPSNTSEESIELVYNIFKQHYELHCTDNTAPYDGITELLKKLRKCDLKTAVISNKADFAVKKLCDKYFPELFELTVGERTGIAKKPSPDSVNEALRTLKIPHEATIYVGDSEVDILTAKNAGIACISVSWGFKDKQFLIDNGATRIADDAEALAELLLA